MPSLLDDLDREKARLEEQLPGYKIWYVWHQPHGKSPGHATWCAQPLPTLSSDSPEHLIEEIVAVHQVAAAEHPALASLEEYAVTSPAVRMARPKLAS